MAPCGLGWRTCSLVSTAGMLLERSDGPRIDAADAVIRVGIGPTLGYERHVGARTDGRWLQTTLAHERREADARAVHAAVADAEPGGVLFWHGHDANACNATLRALAACHPTVRACAVAPAAASLARTCLDRPPLGGRTTVPTSGFVALYALLSASVCSTLWLWGFADAADAHTGPGARYHYWSARGAADAAGGLGGNGTAGGGAAAARVARDVDVPMRAKAQRLAWLRARGHPAHDFAAEHAWVAAHGARAGERQGAPHGAAARGAGSAWLPPADRPAPPQARRAPPSPCAPPACVPLDARAARRGCRVWAAATLERAHQPAERSPPARPQPQPRQPPDSERLAAAARAAGGVAAAGAEAPCGRTARQYPLCRPGGPLPILIRSPKAGPGAALT